MRKQLFVNCDTMERLQDLASKGYSFTEACKTLRRKPAHLRDTAEERGRLGELREVFPRVRPYQERTAPPENEGANLRHLRPHQISAPLHVPDDRATSWLTKSWRAA